MSGEMEVFSLDVGNSVGREIEIISIKQCNDELDKRSGSDLPATN